LTRLDGRLGEPSRPDRIRLLALDIDDTLTGTDGKISPANLAAVRQAMADGILVTAITGRRYRRSAERFADDIGIDGPIACYYGRALVEHPSGRFVRRHCLPETVSRQVLAYAAQHSLFPSLCADEVCFFDRSIPGGPPAGLTRSQYGWVDDLPAQLDMCAERVMWIGLSGPRAGGVGEALAPQIRAGLVTVYVETLSNGDALAFVLAGGCDKGTALLELCGMLGVDTADAVALGDGDPDIPMLRAAGWGIAMPWAGPQVREAADCVAAGGREDAAGLAIRAALGTVAAR
jgi:hydroxymethylpyrimidine pyrophosphatase-like HAD family hydrolase